MTLDTDLLPDPLPIRRRGPVDIAVRPPGSKSQTNRALVCAGLAEGASRLRRPLLSDDSMAMRKCLAELGIEVQDRGGDWTVGGTGGVFAPGPAVTLDAGASGTTARFVTGLAALAGRSVTIDGTERMRERPIGPLVAALSAAGVDISDRGGYPPVVVRGGRLRGGSVTIDASASSQFLSSLLMVAPFAEPTMEITTSGLASAGYVTTTIEVMHRFGVDVTVADGKYRVPDGPYQPADLAIEADASAAVYVWAAAAITAGRAVVEGIPEGSTQPDLGFLDVLAAMGCTVAGHAVQGPDVLRPIDVDLSHMPDGAMTVAMLCATASGTSRLRGLETLRLKETDRLAALITELRRVGAPARSKGDTLIIDGGHELQGAVVDTYDDHRMAMAFAVLGTAVPGVSIADPGCVAKTWPGFFQELSAW